MGTPVRGGEAITTDKCSSGGIIWPRAIFSSLVYELFLLLVQKSHESAKISWLFFVFCLAKRQIDRSQTFICLRDYEPSCNITLQVCSRLSLRISILSRSSWSTWLPVSAAHYRLLFQLAWGPCRRIFGAVTVCYVVILPRVFFRHKQHNSFLVLPVSIGKTLQVLDTSKSTYMPRQIQFLIVLRESVISRPI